MGHIRNDGHNPRVQILIQPNIGLDGDTRQSVVEILNILLADEAVLTQKTRCAHWNIQGEDFYNRHIILDAQYKQLNALSDELSKRIRVLGSMPIGSFQEFLIKARLVEQPDSTPNIMDLLADQEASIRFLREYARKCIEEYEDEGTFELLVKILRCHEEMAWMLRSYVESEMAPEKRSSKGEVKSL